MFLTDGGVRGSLSRPSSCPVLQEAPSDMAKVWFGCNGAQEASGLPAGDSSADEVGEKSTGDGSNVAAR